jgi:hypothetical protein
MVTQLLSRGAIFFCDRVGDDTIRAILNKKDVNLEIEYYMGKSGH